MVLDKVLNVEEREDVGVGVGLVTVEYGVAPTITTLRVGKTWPTLHRVLVCMQIKWG